jgi:hypothetical protein
MIGGLIFTLAISIIVIADDAAWPKEHPCTGEQIPLTTEKSVVLAIECLYKGRVAKVKKVDASDGWYYELRILISGGRIKTLDVHPETGLPLDPAELEAIQ